MQSRLRERENSLAHAERVEYLAFHDGLTGLPNRSMFSKLLNQSIAERADQSRKWLLALLIWNAVLTIGLVVLILRK